MNYMIETKGVYKSIDKNEIIKNLNLTVKERDIFVLIGPNGAGKSTTIKLLNGILKQDKGDIKLFGDSLINEKTRENIGILSDSTLLYGHLTGVENVLFFAELYGAKKNNFLMERINRLFDLLNLSEAKNQKVVNYSTGMKKRVQMIKSVIHNPDLIFLDEPTSGLDPEAVKEVNDFILYLQREEGKTIFLCSHHLDEVEVLGDEFGFLSNGRMFAQDSLKELQKQLYNKATFKVSHSPHFNKLSFNNDIVNDNILSVEYANEVEFSNIIKELTQYDISIYDINKTKTTLKDVYFKLLEESKNELEKN